nr:cytochrome P450 4V2-like isoform X1 [Onthophagus taurus]
MFFTSLIVVTIVAFLSLTVWWYFIFFKYKRYLKHFCVIPTQFPPLGMTSAVRNTVDLYNKMESYGKAGAKNVFVMIGPIPSLCTSDPKLISIILKSAKHIDKPYLFQFALKRFLENSLLIVNGDEWRQQRKLLNPALDYANVIGNITIINESSDDLVKELKEETNNESTDVSHIMDDWMLKLTFESLLGDSGTEYIKKETQETIKLLMKFTIQKIISPLTYFTATYIFTRMYWQERKALKTLKCRLREIIKRKKDEFHSGLASNRKPIFIDILMKLMVTNNITEEFIANQINLMISAAFDTTATTLAFLLYNLSRFPEVQQKAFEEVYSILGEDIDQSITNQQVNEMKYLDLVIQESMRLTTTVPVFGRTLNEDVDYEGNILPKGLTVFMVPFVMHNHPDLYPEPENFIPERFLPENLNPNRYSYTPFNAGIRNCIGKKFAILSLKIALSKLLLNYEFVNVHHKLCFSIEMMLRSKTGIRVGIRKRNY